MREMSGSTRHAHWNSRSNRTPPGPGKWRGGAGVQKTSMLLDAENAVISYICDRERAVVWGDRRRVAINAARTDDPPRRVRRRANGSARYSPTSRWEPAISLRVLRPGGGGFGDPLDRDPEAVKEDVVDEYVSIERALQGLRRRHPRNRSRSCAHTKIDYTATDAAPRRYSRQSERMGARRIPDDRRANVPGW